MKRITKILSIILSGLLLLSSVPTFAYELDENGNSIEEVTYQTSDEEDFSATTSVFAELGSYYKVTIPKVIVLSGTEKKAQYYVHVEGDIAGEERINVVPSSTVQLYSKNKEMQLGTIIQDKVEWNYGTFSIDATGIIEAEGITAGLWSGTFDFDISLTKSVVLGDIILPEGGHVHLVELSDPDLVQQLFNDGYLENEMQLEAMYDAQIVGDVEFPATLTFDVSVPDGYKIAFYHHNGTEWEFITLATVTDGKVTATFTSLSPVALIVDRMDISNAVITLDQDTFDYDGTAKTPSVTSVKLGEYNLVENKDYTVSYENNENPGTANVVLTGIGYFKGTASKDYSIDGIPVRFVVNGTNVDGIYSLGDIITNETPASLGVNSKPTCTTGSYSFAGWSTSSTSTTTVSKTVDVNDKNGVTLYAVWNHTHAGTANQSSANGCYTKAVYAGTSRTLCPGPVRVGTDGWDDPSTPSIHWAQCQRCGWSFRSEQNQSTDHYITVTRYRYDPNCGYETIVR